MYMYETNDLVSRCYVYNNVLLNFVNSSLKLYKVDPNFAVYFWIAKKKTHEKNSV